MIHHWFAMSGSYTVFIWVTILSGAWTVSGDEMIKPLIVNADNFVRVETAIQFDRVLEFTGETNCFCHLRQPTPLDKQSVIRMNRDTHYSAAVVDISEGATSTVPDSLGRYMSIMVVNQDHYIKRVIHRSGTYELTQEEFGTPFVNLSVRRRC